MLDLNFIRENSDVVRHAIEVKHCKVDLDQLLVLDGERRKYVNEADQLKATRNRVSEEIGNLKKKGEDASDVIKQMKTVSDSIKMLDEKIRDIETEMHTYLQWIPNIPHSSVPIGSEKNNVQVKEWGVMPQLDFEPQAHWDLGPKLGLVDFERASRLSGSNFVSFTGKGAKLVRGLINFMLDLHTEKHGFTEANVPIILKRDMMFGTGQLPKLEEDMYHVEKDDLFLIPTAEVSVTNLHREEIMEADQLPVRYAAYTPCFRREAGSYGADTRGLMRIHQFDKVELVKFVRPETSYDELELLLKDAEEVLQLLNLPYRVLALATGDLSFAAAKCYDIEVCAAGIGRWLEVSSCSNFESFQARRMNIRFRPEKGAKVEYVHTLNGSGLALPRTIIAIIENYQTADGKVVVPEVLQKYLGTDILE